MNKLTLTKIEHPRPEIIQYRYHVEGNWTYFFDPDNELQIQYDQKVDCVSDSVAVIPFIGNFLVLAALQDAVICINEVDSDFYDCIPKVITGFHHAMPESVHFKIHGLVQANHIVKNHLDHEHLEKNLLFYSGGVDAGSSYVSHWKEIPTLVSVIGADVKCENQSGADMIAERTRQASAYIGSQTAIIRSNFRSVYQDDHINDYSYELVHDWWWPSFHHSVAMMCLAAPLANGHISKIYFAGTYCKKYERIKVPYILASNPLIDNAVRFCGCQVIHDGYEFSRLEKIDRICKFSKAKKIQYPLRVCYHSTMGDNCCHCEKCVRTIAALLLLGYDPNEFGFTYNLQELPCRFVDAVCEMAHADKFAILAFYTELQELFMQKYREDQVPPELKLFYHCNLSELTDFIRAHNTIQESDPEPVQVTKPESVQTIDEGKDQLRIQYESLQAENEQLKSQLQQIENSHCWKMTRWIRVSGDVVKSVFHRGVKERSK